MIPENQVSVQGRGEQLHPVPWMDHGAGDLPAMVGQDIDKLPGTVAIDIDMATMDDKQPPAETEGVRMESIKAILHAY